jgi:hypothetical protein
MAGTRAVLGVGIGLLLADRLNPDQRKVVGWTMFSIGAISAIHLAYEFFDRERRTRQHQPTGEDYLRTGWWK